MNLQTRLLSLVGVALLVAAWSLASLAGGWFVPAPWITLVDAVALLGRIDIQIAYQSLQIRRLFAWALILIFVVLLLSHLAPRAQALGPRLRRPAPSPLPSGRTPVPVILVTHFPEEVAQHAACRQYVLSGSPATLLPG